VAVGDEGGQGVGGAAGDGGTEGELVLLLAVDALDVQGFQELGD
jgi:hypothetical protein